MSFSQTPVINHWYVNLIGKPMKVKALLYSGNNVSRLVLQYPEGHTHIIGLDAWNCLDLEKHDPVNAGRAHPEGHQSIA
jgi:hypothetical protein